MRSWVKPRTEVQKFEANEYVATCWGVGCDVSWANRYEEGQGDIGRGVTHEQAHCGNPANQVIKDYDNDKIADAMIETKTDGLGDLVCTIYWDQDYSSPRDVSSVGIGETIYWTTTATDGRTWNHKGTVFGTVPGHPNRS